MGLNKKWIFNIITNCFTFLFLMCQIILFFFSFHQKDADELVDLLIQMRHKKPLEPEDLGVEDSKMPVIKYDNIIDEEMSTQIDQGLCLSMHQPYASLLVAGVKKCVPKCFGYI